VIDVCVAHHHRIDLLRVEPEVPVEVIGLLTPALKEPAVEEDLVTIGHHEMAGPGYRTRSTMEFYMQGFVLSSCWPLARVSPGPDKRKELE
jgi:hypothetical protein